MSDPRPEPAWRRRPDALWRRSLDAVVLLPAGAAEPVLLPGSGAAVWDLLAAPTTVAELVGALVEVYGGDPVAITADVAELLERLGALDGVEEV